MPTQSEITNKRVVLNSFSNNQKNSTTIKPEDGTPK